MRCFCLAVYWHRMDLTLGSSPSTTTGAAWMFSGLSASAWPLLSSSGCFLGLPTGRLAVFFTLIPCSWVEHESCLILLHLASSCFILLNLVSSLPHRASSCLILSHLVSSCLILLHLASSCFILSHLASSCLTLLNLVSSCLILLCLA